MANIEDLRDRSVSSGTLKSEDLIPKFLGVLKTYGKDKYDEYIKENPEVEDWENLDEETMGWVVDELADLLNEIAPDGCYFGASEGDGADFGFWSMSNESKKSEVSSLAAFDIEDVVGKKLGWTWDDDKSCLVDKDGTEVGWDESDCITIDPVEDENGNVLTQVNMWGDGTVEFQDENGESVNWTEFDDATVKKVVAVLDGKSEAKKVPVQEDGNKDIFTLDLTRIDADGDEDGLDDMQVAQTFYDEDDAIKAAKELADSYKDDDGVVQVIVMAGEQEKPNGDIVGDSFDIYWASSSDKQTTTDYRKKARYAAFDTKMDYYAKGGKSEGNDDDKGCKGKDCKDDKTKKNEADATFKVGDFVTYDAASDGKEDFINEYVSAEIAEINDDGSLVLWIYDLDDGGNDVKDADPQFCTKLDHYAGKVDADHYYMDGPYKAYKGGWEILITKKDLNPRVYEFIGTMDDLGEVLDVDAYYGGENFVYDEDLKDEVATNTVWDVETTTFADMTGDVGESKQTEGLPPKKLGNRLYRSRADLINKMKTLDAVEITTPAQFNDIHSKQWLHTAGYAMDINGNLVGQTYFGDKDGKWYYATTKTFQGDYLPECKEEAKKSEKASVTCSICGNPTDDPIWGEGNRAFCKDCYSDGDDFKHGKTKFVVGMMISLDGVKQYIRELKPRTFVGQSVDTGKEFSLPISSLNRASILYDPRNESKKSESLTLKQKELKDMARFGQAEDITTISDAEAKELKKKGIETIGVSRGTYGMNGALLRDNEGKKYVITARSSNLFYFV